MGKLGRRPALGRADLVRAFVRSGNDDEDMALAQAIGYRLDEDGPGNLGSANGGNRLSVGNKSKTPKRTSSAVANLGSMPFWRMSSVQFTPLASEAASGHSTLRDVAPLSIQDVGPPATRSPPPPRVPLADSSRLRRFLEQLRRRPRPVGEIDTDAIIDEVVRGRPIERLPRHLRSIRVPHLVVIADRASRLIPFWQDQQDVWDQLEREFGAQGLSPVSWTDGAPEVSSIGQVMDALGRRLAPGDAVLVLGDLGLYGSIRDQARWRSLGRVISEYGATAAALLPCPAEHWRKDTIHHWRVVDWSRPTRTRAGAITTKAERRQRRDQLLALLSWAVRIEPELLRAVRVSMPHTMADVGTEADAWNHRDLGRHSAGLLFRSDPTQPLEKHSRRRYQAMLVELVKRDHRWREQLAEVVALVRHHHAAGPRETWLEEVWVLELLGLGDVGLLKSERDIARHFVSRVRATLKERVSLGPTVGLHSWGRRAMSTRVPATAWRDPVLGEELTTTYALLHPRKSERVLPPGLDMERLSEVDELGEVQSWEILQLGEELRVVPAESRSERGSPFGPLIARAPGIAVGSQASPKVEHALAKSGVRLLRVLDSGRLELDTDCQRLVIERFEAPRWATAGMGRDEHGLWASFRVGDVEQRMRWIPPGRFMSGAKAGDPGVPEVPRTIHEGYWLAESPCTQAMWVAVMGENPSAFEGSERPVERVPLEMVRQFVQKLQRLLGTGEIGLPDEDRWEYACRAGTTGATYAAPDEIAWFGEAVENEGGWGRPWGNTGKSVNGTRSVGLKRSNAWGLFDTLGNVAEWCELENTPLPGTGGSGGSAAGAGLAAGLGAASTPADDPFASSGDDAFTASSGNNFDSPGIDPAPARASAPAEESPRVDALTGRSENPVLFSLDSLKAMASTQKPASADPVRQAPSTTAPSSEGSGLIDIRAMGVARGGSWRSTELHVASREVQRSTFAAEHLGFRLFASKEWHPIWADASGHDERGPWACVRIGDVDLLMRWIPPGRFMMGSPYHESGRYEDEGPQHLVTITRGFWMAETACTQALWESVMSANPSHFEGPKRPVENVSWDDVQEFIARLDARTDPGWMLPNEAQWEYACRAGTTAAWYGPLGEVAWYDENADGETHAVGQKRANAWGLHDMLGNVDEWCADGKRSYEGKAVEDPASPPGGAGRVSRGGSWDSDARFVRAASRDAHEPGNRLDDLGFRLVRGQGLRQASERSESRPGPETSEGGKARAGDPPGSRPAWLQDEDDR